MPIGCDFCDNRLDIIWKCNMIETGVCMEYCKKVVAVISGEELFADFINSALVKHSLFEIRRVESRIERAVSLCAESLPDLMLVDIDSAGSQAIKDLLSLRKRFPTVVFVVATDAVDEFLVVQALRAHLVGFLYKKEMTFSKVVSALEELVSGRQFWSPSLRKAGILLSQRSNSWHRWLTDRECDYVRVFASEGDPVHAAAKLGVARASMRTLKSRILRKLGLRSSIELAGWAQRKGFLRP
jgi:DNA-binding NarL/FixJ family response regulator